MNKIEERKLLEAYNFNSFEDKNYPLVLVILTLFIVVPLFVTSVFCFRSHIWSAGIFCLLGGLVTAFAIFLCARECFLSRREKKNEEKEASNEKKL